LSGSALGRLLNKPTRIRLGMLWQDLAAYPRFSRLVRGARLAGGPRVFYGSEEGAGARVHGGAIKRLLLEPEFPNASTEFNVVYLVSSALPEGARALARLAARRNVPLVLNQDGVAYPAWHGPGWRETNGAPRALLAAASHVFYQSRFCREAVEAFVGTPACPSEILYNAVDTRAFSPRADPACGQPLRLLLAGNQDQSYRVSVALQVARRLNAGGLETQLTITGRLRWREPAVAEAEARAEADRHGIGSRVAFVGPYDYATAPELFRGSDVLLHTKYNDPCPSVVIEALASGVPVVYSASGGVPELVGEGAGIGVAAASGFERDEPPDPVALADAVERVARARPRFSEAARRSAVERFDSRPWLDRHRRVFEALSARG
jgi:glycosyltransferase involved in cell wall biosynthesis